MWHSLFILVMNDPYLFYILPIEFLIDVFFKLIRLQLIARRIWNDQDRIRLFIFLHFFWRKGVKSLIYKQYYITPLYAITVLLIKWMFFFQFFYNSVRQFTHTYILESWTPNLLWNNFNIKLLHHLAWIQLSEV